MPLPGALRCPQVQRIESSISNNVGPVKSFLCFFCALFSFFEHTAPLTPASGLVRFVDLCIDDHGSFVIFRSASVRPNHLSDHYSSRGRDTSCLAPPAQSRTGRFPACGSYRRYLASKRM